MSLSFTVPVDPDAQTAREWLENELRKAEYQDQPGESLIEVLLRWVERILGNLERATSGLGGGIPGSVVALILLAFLTAALLWLVLGPLRSSRRRKTSAAVFDDDTRDLETLRKASAAAAAAAEWTVAVIERFRVVVRTLENENIVAVVPGMTASEVSQGALRAMPDHEFELVWAADTFDGLRYGHNSAGAADYTRMCALEEAAKKAQAVKVS